jgi:hypothetical protein
LNLQICGKDINLKKKMMKKTIILFVIAALLFTNVIAGVQSIYADNSLSNKQIAQILEEIDPHIVSYDFNTHEVKYGNGRYTEPYGSEDFDPDHNRTHNLFDFTRTRDNPSVHFGAIS